MCRSHSQQCRYEIITVQTIIYDGIVAVCGFQNFGFRMKFDLLRAKAYLQPIFAITTLIAISNSTE